MLHARLTSGVQLPEHRHIYADWLYSYTLKYVRSTHRDFCFWVSKYAATETLYSPWRCRRAKYGVLLGLQLEQDPLGREFKI